MTEIDRNHHPSVYVAAQQVYDAVPYHIKEDLKEALSWAEQVLTNHEGTGHYFTIIHEDGGFKCCFAKPQWNADHCSQAMDKAPEAIVMAVCEYLNGV